MTQGTSSGRRSEISTGSFTGFSASQSAIAFPLTGGHKQFPIMKGSPYFNKAARPDGRDNNCGSDFVFRITG